MTGEIFATGRCLCGAVSYEIGSAPVRMAQCHCLDCQRASGTGHMSMAFFKKTDVALEGQTKSFAVVADSGNTVTRHFCPDCGSRIYSEGTGRPGLVGMAIGLMENTDWFEPVAVVFTRHRRKWDATPTDIPNFETMQPIPKPASG